MQRSFSVFCRHRAGSYSILAGLTMSVLVGIGGLGTEAGLWYYKQQSMQAAADSGALSAATANSGNIAALETQATSVAAAYGYVDGADGSTVTVNRPPATGAYTGTANAVEVIVAQPQARIFSLIYGSDQVPIEARAVAAPVAGQGCVVALSPSAASAVTLSGSADVTLNGCGLYSNSNNATSVSSGGSSNLQASTVRAAGGVTGEDNMTTTQGIFENLAPTTDPYADVAQPATPAGCAQTNYATNATVTISPGVYCGGIRANAGAVVTLTAGTYYLKSGSLTVNGGASITGTGVTLVMTGSGSDYATANISGGATINLTAPTTGPTAGIVVFGDRNMPIGTTFKLNGGSNQYLEGAVYAPRAALEFAGGSGSSSDCTQLLANTITFSGNANLALNCTGAGVLNLGASMAMLVE